MGPSGSGKSTLIDALAQRIGAVKGSMTLNGNQFGERLLRNISAYVMQVNARSYRTNLGYVHMQVSLYASLSLDFPSS